MKKIILAGLLFASVGVNFGQNVGINSTGATPDISAMLDIVANNKGLLVPRVALTSTADAVTVATPATSLLVYNTATAGVSPNNVVPGYYYNSGTTVAPNWVRLATGNGPSWLLTGNAGTTASTAAYGVAANNNFIGTLDARDWVMATNNLERMRILTGGQVAVGTKVSTNSAIFNIVSSAGGAPNTSTLYLQGPGQNGFGLSGVVDVFDNQATPQREAVLGYSVGAPWYGMMNLYGSSGGTEQRMGEFDFMNRVLQPADARIATIVGNTPAGVSNSGSLEFITRNAGTFISNAFWINFDGRTAVGNRAPASKFDVEGNTSIGTGYAGTTAAPANGLIVEGNVGLGVSNPAYNTEINGTFGFGNGTAGAYRSRTETRNDAGLIASQSGFYETVAPVNYPAGASSWWHLIDSRHSNNGNNYALQISGSFFDQNLYFRKTNNVAAQPWSQFLTSTGTISNAWLITGNSGTVAATNFIGTTDAVDWVMRTSNIERARITSAGSYGIGIAAPTQRLDVQGGNARINNAFVGDVGHGAGWGGFSHSLQNNTTGYAMISSNDGNYTLINKENTGAGYIGFRVANTDQAVILNNGDMGIGTTAPVHQLDISGAGGATVDLRTTGRMWTNSSSGGLWMSDLQDCFLGNISATQFGFWTSSVGWNAFNITKATGYTGIGTTAPTARLHVVDDANNLPVIYGVNINASAGTTSFGVRGECGSTGLGSAGVSGVSTNSSQNEIGVLGDYSLWGTGVFGMGWAAAYTDMPTTRDFGVFGTVNYSTGTGVYGRNTNVTLGSAYGMYCMGNFAVTGAKAATIPTSQGNQLVYSMESPEVWFEDAGYSKLVNGSIHINLGDLFLEAILADDEHPFLIFTQEMGESQGLIIIPDADWKGFTVKEKNGGASNIAFSFRIMAKRRFYEDVKFGVDANQPFENNIQKAKHVEPATTDPQKMKQFVDEKAREKEALDKAKKGNSK